MSILDEDFEGQIARKIEFSAIFPYHEREKERGCEPFVYKLFVHEEEDVHRVSHIGCNIYESTRRDSHWTPVEFTLIDRQKQLFEVKAIYPGMIKRRDVLDRQRVIDEWDVDDAWVDTYDHYQVYRLTVKYPIFPKMTASMSSQARQVLYGYADDQPQLSDPIDIEILIYSRQRSYFRDAGVKLRIA